MMMREKKEQRTGGEKSSSQSTMKHTADEMLREALGGAFPAKRLEQLPLLSVFGKKV